jgi:hypothetical protein
VDHHPSTSTVLTPADCGGHTYWYRIALTVTDPDGLSARFEKEVFLDCPGIDQSINFAPIPGQSLSDGPVTLDAAASSGLPVIFYLASGPASLAGNVLTPTAPGTITVVATQPGNETYAQAQPVTRSFSVAPGGVTGLPTYSFRPVDDAYLQGTTRFNDAHLKVAAGYRVSYLKFNVSGLSGPVQSAKLLLHENGDIGSGTLRVHRGSHNNWTETTLTAASAPIASGQVGLFTGAVTSAQTLSIEVTPLITGNGTYSVVLLQDAGGNDIWFGSEESPRKPQLIVKTSGGSAPSYALTVNGGSGSGSYTAGSTVNLIASSPPVGQEFDRWTGDTANVANVNAATTSITMPAAPVSVTATYRPVSTGGTFNFMPIDDAYLQGSTRFNDMYLKVAAGYRVSYLKFNVSGLSGTVQSATLRLQENGDTGSGTLRVHRGNHNNWTETTLTTANAPTANGQVGLFTGAVAAAQTLNINVTPLVIGNGTYSVILVQDAGGNDIWFGSEESLRKPQLIVNTSGGSTPSYALTVNSGSGSGSYTAGSTVNLIASSPPVGQEFDRWTGDTANVANVNAATTSIAMPAAPVSVTATYRPVSTGGTSSFTPVDDACLQGITRFNDVYLKVAAGYRVSYLKFNVSGLSGTVQSATLRIQENGDVGSGTLRVHRGSHNNWTETTLTTANAPTANGQVGLLTGAVTAAQIVNVNVTPLVTGNGTYSVVLLQDTGGNDIWFGSEESPRKPQLIVTTSGSGATGLALSSLPDATTAPSDPAPFGRLENPWLGMDREMDEAATRSGTVPPASPPPHIRVTRLNPIELELAWDVETEADYEIQLRRSWSDEEWITTHHMTVPPGTFRIPVVIRSQTIFLRVVRIQQDLSKN